MGKSGKFVCVEVFVLVLDCWEIFGNFGVGSVDVEWVFVYFVVREGVYYFCWYDWWICFCGDDEGNSCWVSCRYWSKFCFVCDGWIYFGIFFVLFFEFEYILMYNVNVVCVD